MADILSFRATRRARRCDDSGHAGGAEIVIFPGVRYERCGSAPASVDRTAKIRRVKRDTLELKD